MVYRALMSCLCIILGCAIPNSCEADIDDTRSPEGCQYKGLNFAKEETWVSITSYYCECNAASRYHCRVSGSTYASLPAFCWFFNNTNACCATATCYFATPIAYSSEQFTGSTTMDGVLTLFGNACVNKVSNCATYGKSICFDPDYATWSNEFCCSYCKGGSSDLPVGMFPTGPDTVVGRSLLGSGNLSANTADPPQGTCNYAGMTYVEHEEWSEECVAQCTCLNGTTGEYHCSYPCGHSQGPADCKMSPNCPAGFNVPTPKSWLWRSNQGTWLGSRGSLID